LERCAAEKDRTCLRIISIGLMESRKKSATTGLDKIAARAVPAFCL